MKNNDNLNVNNKHVYKVFKDPLVANKAYHYLLNNGYSDQDIHIVMSDATRDKYFNDKDIEVTSLGSKAVEGMGVGGAIGSAIGGVAAALAAVGTVLTIPGLGLVVAGPLAASLAGAGAGGAIGTLIGAICGAELPSDQAAIYEDDIKNGGILITVSTDENKRASLEATLNNLN